MDDFSIAELTGLQLDRAGAERLQGAFRTQAEGIARFSEAELKAVEPPLRVVVVVGNQESALTPDSGFPTPGGAKRDCAGLA
jgi:hypothetical protein